MRTAMRRGARRAPTPPVAGPETVTDLYDEVMFVDPHPRYRELRERAPVSRARTALGPAGTWLLTRYDDVLMVHTDPRFSSQHPMPTGLRARLLPKFAFLLLDSMVFKDDPDHLRLRRLVNRAFTPKMVASLEEDARAVRDELLDAIEAKARRGEAVDLVEELAVPLPLTVIARMLGVSARDRDEFHALVRAFTELPPTGVGRLKALPLGRRLMRMFERMIAEARAHRDDRIVSALVRAHDEDDDRLSDAEIVAMVFLLLFAGHDTTSGLISTGTLALLENPDQLALLHERPELTGTTAVDELLRFCSPVACGADRILTEDVELHGTTLPAGSHVLGMIVSANRDADHFPDPDRLDLTRDPNPHLAFAFGTHYCLGNQLARLEGRLAFEGLARRFSDVRLEPGFRVTYKPTQSLRGLMALPVRLAPA
ncbi:MAG TPA: cytochrome P450 [Acidimicrobiales bacterium]